MFKTTCTRRSTFIGILFTVITICVLIVSGCASKPAATAPSTSAATTPAPVQQEVFKWRFQDVATKGQIHFDWRTRFVERVNEMSNGRLVITQYPAGALVKTSEMFDSVSKGGVDVVSATASYWSGIIGPVGTMGWCIPYSYSNPREMDTFLKGPYTEMMRDVHGKFNIHYLGQQLVSSYPIISSKPIRTVDDLAKLKIRCVGLTAHTVVKIGGRTVNVPADEIYTGLATGVFDGCAWGGPSQTHALGLHEVAKYYLLPAVADVCYNEMIINKDSWNKLPADLKQIVAIAWDSISWSCYKEMENFDQEYLADYQKTKGVTVTKFSDADIAKMRTAAMAVLDEQVAAKDTAWGKKIVDQLKADLKAKGYMN